VLSYYEFFTFLFPCCNVWYVCCIKLIFVSNLTSVGTPASSTTKTGRHDIAESGVKLPKIRSIYLSKQFPMGKYLARSGWWRPVTRQIVQTLVISSSFSCDHVIAVILNFCLLSSIVTLSPTILFFVYKKKKISIV
jgi:hypothetical protein